MSFQIFSCSCKISQSLCFSCFLFSKCTLSVFIWVKLSNEANCLFESREGQFCYLKYVRANIVAILKNVPDETLFLIITWEFSCIMSWRFVQIWCCMLNVVWKIVARAACHSTNLSKYLIRLGFRHITEARWREKNYQNSEVVSPI